MPGLKQYLCDYQIKEPLKYLCDYQLKEPLKRFLEVLLPLRLPDHQVICAIYEAKPLSIKAATGLLLPSPLVTQLAQHLGFLSDSCSFHGSLDMVSTIGTRHQLIAEAMVASA